MNGLLRRLLKLEPPAKAGAVRIVWNDGSEAARAEAERLKAEGYRVMLVGWQGRQPAAARTEEHRRLNG